MKRWLAGLAVGGVLGLAACAATPSGPGRWQPLPLAGVRLAPLELAAPATRRDPEVCRYARDHLERRLSQILPGRLAPLTFAGPQADLPAGGAIGTLQVTLLACRIESHQWDVGGEPDITFYQTLDLRVRLTGPEGILLDRRLRTVEQIQSGLPTPLFDFPHHVPAARIAQWFSRGRVWRSQPPTAPSANEQGRSRPGPAPEGSLAAGVSGGPGATTP